MAFYPPASTAQTSSSSPPSLCAARETVVFSCRTGSKVLSVCASESGPHPERYLQYRYGTVGQPIELTIPGEKVSADRAAAGKAVGFSGGGGAWLRFRNADYAYIVYSGIGNWGAKGEKLSKAGVAVERTGKPVANIRCEPDSTISELGAELFTRFGIKEDHQEFFFPD